MYQYSLFIPDSESGLSYVTILKADEEMCQEMRSLYNNIGEPPLVNLLHIYFINL